MEVIDKRWITLIVQFLDIICYLNFASQFCFHVDSYCVNEHQESMDKGDFVVGDTAGVDNLSFK